MRFDFEWERWENDLPPLQTARWNSSSCSLAGYVYVFCGEDITTIEKLRVVASLSEQKQQVWQIIESNNLFSIRSWPVACPLNPDLILITTRNYYKAFELDTRTDQVR